MSLRLIDLCHSKATTCCAVLCCAGSRCGMGGLDCIFFAHLYCLSFPGRLLSMTAM